MNTDIQCVTVRVRVDECSVISKVFVGRDKDELVREAELWVYSVRCRYDRVDVLFFNN